MLKKEAVILSDTIEFPEFDKELGNELKSLCDRVCCSTNITLNSHNELLEFKQSILNEKIPPTVLVTLSLLSGNIVKNGIELQFLINELVRIVKKNSYLLQEHMPKFMKLCDDYQKKCRQLDVAVKKLELQDEKYKQIRRKEVLQNWELLFTKVQLSQSHGRRWKYLIFDFKEKANKGPSFLREYFQNLLNEDDGLVETVKERRKSTPKSAETKPESVKPENTLEIKDLDDEEEEEEEEEYQESFEEKESVDSPEPIETKDVKVGTSDSNYTQALIMRLYNPKGLGMQGDLLARITYGSKNYQTGNLNKTIQAKEEEARIEREYDESLATHEAPTAPTKGGLIGKRKPKQAKTKHLTPEEVKRLQQEKKLRELKRNETVRIPIPVEVTAGMLKDSLYQSLQISLCSVDNPEKCVAKATIEIEELLTLIVPVYNEFVYRGDEVTPPGSPTSTVGEDGSIYPFPKMEPMLFPVYEESETSRIQSGQLPISMYWSKEDIPDTFHRCTESWTINELVEELTGINLEVTTKEELTREKVDESISPRPLTPPPETVLKEEYESMENKYQTLMSEMEEEYKAQIESLNQKLVEEMNKPVPVQENKDSRPTSIYHKDCAVSPIFPYRPQPGYRHAGIKNDKSATTADKPYSSKSRDTLSTSGPDDQDEIVLSDTMDESKKVILSPEQDQSALRPKLPENFVERVSVYSELSSKHQEQLKQKVKKEVSTAIEMKLSEMFRLHTDLTEEDVATALDDMCLPAVYMPFTNASGTIYNPRAHQYFHPVSLKYLRLSQAPSIFKLPPIKETQLSMLNLLDMGNQLRITRVPEIKSDNKIKKKIKNDEYPIPPETTRVIMEEI